MIRGTRRAFLLSIGAIALGTPSGGRTQPATRVHRVAITNTAERTAPFFVSLERRFRELGYVEEKNFALEYRSIAGRWDKLPEVAADLARTRPDVAIAPGSEIVLRAFRQAMGATPIVMIAIDFDPLERNFIASLACPGGEYHRGLFPASRVRREAAGPAQRSLTECNARRRAV